MVSVPPALDVHLYGIHAAVVTRGHHARIPGRVHGEWTHGAARHWGDGRRVVSHGLPVHGDARVSTRASPPSSTDFFLRATFAPAAL